jgi:hypothetical protein
MSQQILFARGSALHCEKVMVMTKQSKRGELWRLSALGKIREGTYDILLGDSGGVWGSNASNKSAIKLLFVYLSFCLSPSKQNFVTCSILPTPLLTDVRSVLYINGNDNEGQQLSWSQMDDVTGLNLMTSRGSTSIQEQVHSTAQ